MGEGGNSVADRAHQREEMSWSGVEWSGEVLFSYVKSDRGDLKVTPRPPKWHRVDKTLTTRL